MKITQDSIERIAWTGMLLLVIMNILAIGYMVNITHKIDSRTAAARANTLDTRKFDLCLAKFFTQENRQQKVISSLDSCIITKVN